MAEIVGLVASILQLVETVSKAREYIHDFRNARKDQKKLLQEIQNLEPLITEFQQRVKDSQIAGSTSTMQKFSKPLNQLKETMERLAKKLEPTGTTRKVSNRLTWSMWGKEEVHEGLNTIERSKSLLSVWLAMNIWNSTQGIASAFQEVTENQQINHKYTVRSVEALGRNQKEYRNDIISTVKGVAEEQRIGQSSLSKSLATVERSQNAADRDTVIEWYSPLNFFLRQADIFSTREPGTGEWLLEDATFKEWRLGGGKTLWCRGMPGAGKTVLASIVIENLRTVFESQNIGVGAIYLNHKETETQTPSHLLCALWRQLVFRKPISEDVRRLYETHRERRTRPSLEDAQAILHSVVSEHLAVFIVVDALDEYPEGQRDSLLRRLSSLGPTVNLLLTSRPHINISHSISGGSDVETLEIRAKDEDICCYLDGQILSSFRLSKHIENSPSLRDEIEEQIVECSGGMFLLAKLHIDSLTTKHTVKAVRETLKNMPIDLEHTYDGVMEHINRQSEDDRKLALHTLLWITNAKRPLRVPELREALSIEPGATDFDSDNLLDPDIILASCAGLVVITAEDDTIRIIHYTMQTYLEQIQARVFPNSQSVITTTCITYLSFGVLSDNMHDPSSLLRQYDFLDYAVEYSLIHARGEPKSTTRHIILPFLANCFAWRNLWNWGHGHEIPRSPARLWLAAFFGLEQICRYLIQEDGAGNVLQEAALEGLTDMVEILIQNGADVNAKEGEYDSVLHAASVRGHEKIISLLIDHGVDIDFRGRYGTALQVATYFGHKESVRVLIAGGANVNAEGGYYGTALYAAASRLGYGIFRLLIENGADTRTGLGLPELLEQGERAMALVLIQCSAGINGALRTAARGGNQANFRLLLDHNGDSELRGEQYAIMLLESLNEAWGRAIDQLLIKHGADINNALRKEARAGNEANFKRLLKYNKNSNARAGQCTVALSEGLHEGWPSDIAKLLIEHGADINNALRKEARAGNEAISGLRDPVVYMRKRDLRSTKILPVCGGGPVGQPNCLQAASAGTMRGVRKGLPQLHAPSGRLFVVG
ncbi:ANK-REP-REGION domain-containing protein [Mycena venus]|uniref:ANK-REP-REGION domain-containing protein n=1 Tax=Mycena venus TaxID=2733690 RepID=A0A8H6X4P1_9AGAR|nr:ANK-REP-REGION domain-containing protein [Mycena venus]